MNQVYARDLDLNLLRVFAVVAESGSVTHAAERLYLTQPAVSAALRRLASALGAELFSRRGRGLVLSRRGVLLHASIQAHLPALLEAALQSESFDARSSERTVRIGLSDASELWLLPALLHHFEREAPRMKVLVLPVQFRSVGQALSTAEVDMAVTVADELPASVLRSTLFWGDFVCLFDPRRRVKHRGKRAINEAEYFASQHVIVSYNGDMRGVVEDVLGRSRQVRCSLPSFSHLGAIVEGSKLLATVPRLVAMQICSLRPGLAFVELPFKLGGAPLELLWPASLDDDPANQFVRSAVTRLAAEFGANQVKPRA